MSDFNRVTASNQFTLPVLSYLMWTQHWPITELRVIDREARKIMTCSMITCHFWGETVINRNFSSMATDFHFKFEMDFEKG